MFCNYIGLDRSCCVTYHKADDQVILSSPANKHWINIVCQFVLTLYHAVLYIRDHGGLYFLTTKYHPKTSYLTIPS